MKVDYFTFLFGVRKIKFPAKSILFFALLFMVHPWSCEYPEPVTSDVADQELKVKTNRPPTSISLVSSADTISFWGDIHLACTVVDPENDSLTYEWSSYRLTDNSTMERYEVIYWLNHGEFIGTGQDVIWKPGKIAGPYLILCTAIDKVGNEITDKKIVQVVSTGCVFVLTDKITYCSSDFDSTYHTRYRVIQWPHLNFSFTVTNHLDIKANLYGCYLVITPGVQKKVMDRWVESIKPDGCTSSSAHDSITREFIRVEVFPGEVVQDTSWTLHRDWTTIDSGEYRLFIPYSLGPYVGDALIDTLYSNEFQIIK